MLDHLTPHGDDADRDHDGLLARALRPRSSSLDRLRALVLWGWKRRVRLASVAAAVLALWLGAPPLLLGPVVPVHPVVRAEFVQSIVASGRVEAPFRVNVASQVTGVVTDIPVAEGQTVKASDPLVVLDDREARSAVVQAEGATAQAEARSRQLRELTLPAAEESMKQAEATLRNAQAAYDRTSKLAAEGHAPRSTLDDVTKSLDIARAQMRNAQLQVFTNRPGGSDYVLAETLLNQARANLVTAQSRLSYTVIKAPRDGVLISRSVERGNVVQPGNVLMVLSPFVDTQLVVLIDEKNLGLIRIGQKALASADAYPRETFAAEVAYINPGVDLQRASVQVKLKVADPPSFLRQDMTVSVDIETARRPGALVVPAADVRGSSNGNAWVLAVDGGRVVRRQVKVGLTGGGKAEMIDGLMEGDLLVSPTTAIEQGRRVRARVVPPKQQ